MTVTTAMFAHGPRVGEVLASPDKSVRMAEMKAPYPPAFLTTDMSVATTAPTFEVKTYHVSRVAFGGRMWRFWTTGQGLPPEQAILCLIDADPRDVKAVEERRDDPH